MGQKFIISAKNLKSTSKITLNSKNCKLNVEKPFWEYFSDEYGECVFVI